MKENLYQAEIGFLGMFPKEKPVLTEVLLNKLNTSFKIMVNASQVTADGKKSNWMFMANNDKSGPLTLDTEREAIKFVEFLVKQGMDPWNVKIIQELYFNYGGEFFG